MWGTPISVSTRVRRLTTSQPSRLKVSTSWNWWWKPLRPNRVRLCWPGRPKKDTSVKSVRCSAPDQNDDDDQLISENPSFIILFEWTGQNVTLECAATGWPRPLVRWTRSDNRPLPSGRYFALGSGAMVLTGLNDEDEGAYSCEVDRGAYPPLKASTMLQLTEPVSMIKSPRDSRVEEGSRISFDCMARGRPPPQYFWVFNGKALRTNSSYVTIEENRLVISKVSKRHAGIFQCFVSNSLAHVDGGAATLEVIPKPRTSWSSEDEEEENDFFDVTPTPVPTIYQDHSSSKSGKGKKGKQHLRLRGKLTRTWPTLFTHANDRMTLMKLEMIPPSRPNMTRLTDESVMVRWSVPSNQGLPIQFFKVQFKEADKRGIRWKTIDEDIPSHIRSYEVTGLNAGFTYR